MKNMPVKFSLISIMSASSEHIWRTAVFIILITGLLMGVLRWQAFEHVQKDEFEKLGFQIELAQKEVAGLVRSTNVVLEEITLALHHDDLATAVKLGEHYKKIFPEIRSFTIVDQAGTIREATIKALIGGDRSQSAYYREALDNPASEMIFLGRPFKDPLGASIMLYGRTITDEMGKLKWIAIASVNLKFYDQLLGSLIDSETQNAFLVHGDGLILSHSLDYEGLRLKSTSQAAHIAEQHLKSTARKIFHKDIVDVNNVKAHAITADVIPENLLASNRLIVSVSEDCSAIFSGWKKDTLIYILVWLVVSILVFYVVHLHSIREKALLYNEDRFKDFTDTASDWIWEMDEQLRFTYISDRFYKISSFKPDDLIGKTRWEYKTAESAGVSEEQWQSHRQAMETHQPFRDFRYMLSNSSGTTYHISLNGKPVYINDKFAGYRGTGTNISLLVSALDEARLAQRKAETASKAKSQFLASMSHELRTPMNAILGYAQLLEMELNDPSQKESIQIMLESGHHLMALINDVLDLSRIETETMEYSIELIDVMKLLQECNILCLPLAAESGCKISLQAESSVSDAYQVKADRVRLKQAILNYLSNAIKYGKQNGGLIKVFVSQRNENLRISVSDNGQGIVADKIDKLFSPFSRLGLEGGPILGAGLGLSITKEIIEGMGGEVGVESTLGEGSVFWLELPLYRSDTDNASV